MEAKLKEHEDAIVESKFKYDSLKEEFEDKEKRVKLLIKKHKQIEIENKELEIAYTNEI